MQPCTTPRRTPFDEFRAVQAKAKALQVFLCHSRPDKAAVRELDGRLKSDGYKAWLDAVSLVPGQDWELEIKNAVRASDIVLVCLSRQSLTRAGFMQKEIKFALDVADEQPEGRIYVIRPGSRSATCPPASQSCIGSTFRRRTATSGSLRR
jgi:hypothetical protein